MKLALAVLLLTTSALAQDQSAIVAAARGPASVIFDVKNDSSQHTLAQPEAGKALVYIMQENGLYCVPGGWCVMNVGIDGAWVGAFKGKMNGSPLNSYFSAYVEPGEHHACVKARSGKRDVSAFAHFSAEAGQVYYLVIRGSFEGETARYLGIGPLDSDEAKYLIATSPLSVSQPRK